MGIGAEQVQEIDYVLEFPAGAYAAGDLFSFKAGAVCDGRGADGEVPPAQPAVGDEIHESVADLLTDGPLIGPEGPPGELGQFLFVNVPLFVDGLDAGDLADGVLDLAVICTRRAKQQAVQHHVEDKPQCDHTSGGKEDSLSLAHRRALLRRAAGFWASLLAESSSAGRGLGRRAPRSTFISGGTVSLISVV